MKDKVGYWASTFQNTFVLAYKTRSVKPADVPRSYDDLLKPMWKGRQIINDTDNFEWFDGLLKFWGKEKGLAYFRRLAAQDQIFQRGARGRIQLVAAGEAPLAFGYGPHAQSYVNQGAPIEWVALEPVVVIVNTVSLAQRAPHPAAADQRIQKSSSRHRERQHGGVDQNVSGPGLGHGTRRAERSRGGHPGGT
jgi:iron(III) transport system substrate-binding protein